MKTKKTLLFFHQTLFVIFALNKPINSKSLFNNFFKSKPQKEINIFITHGTMSSDTEWYKQGGDFFQSVQESATNLFTKNKINMHSFSWSGGVFANSRLEAAYQFCEAACFFENVITIGHSHGGNIISLASQLMELATDETLTKDIIEKKLKDISNNLQEDEIRELKQQKKHKSLQLQATSLPQIEKEAFKVFEKIQNLTHKKSNNQKFKIKQHIMLGCPINQKCYLPSLKIIENVYSFFSPADLVQTVFGLYQRQFTNDAQNALNIELIFKLEVPLRSKQTITSPSHGEMHAPLLGQNLFQITNKINTKLNDKLIEKDNLSIILSSNNDIEITNNSTHNHKPSLQSFLQSITELFFWDGNF